MCLTDGREGPRGPIGNDGAFIGAYLKHSGPSCNDNVDRDIQESVSLL